MKYRLLGSNQFARVALFSMNSVSMLFVGLLLMRSGSCSLNWRVVLGAILLLLGVYLAVLTGSEVVEIRKSINTRQKKIINAWPQLLKIFLGREWISLFLSSAIGILAAEFVHLLLLDHSFQSFLVSKYKPSASFDNPKYYLPYLSIFCLAILLTVVALLCGYAWRGLKSLLAGVTSGLLLLPFCSAFLFSIVPSLSARNRLFWGCLTLGVWCAGSFVLFLIARIHAERNVKEDEFTVPIKVRSLAGTQISASDDPIQSWEQDALGRAALVDSLSIKIMIAKVPVLALSGAFGVGKTSTLNLLREHLGDSAIIVSFSTWLPGSQETLTSYLLADIANECKKHYVVPGLLQSTRRLARALGEKVPLLGDYLKLVPSATQKDNIDNLKRALLRLPRRVVVLLDEIDRMEKDEILTLLKVIRGISTLPNLTFVCAGHYETIVKTVRGKFEESDNEYFEKFFPVRISMPDPDPAALHKAGIERQVLLFSRGNWFENDDEIRAFQKRLEDLWDSLIAPFCSNLRTIGLLANDVSIAEAPLRREVDPIDLILVEMLHRFRPSVYELVSKNALALTGGEDISRGGRFGSEDIQKSEQAKLTAKLNEILGDEDFGRVKAVLDVLFPDFEAADRRVRTRFYGRTESLSEGNDKRIRQPGIFPAYFRHEIPEAIFSFVQLAEFAKRFELAQQQDARDAVFLEVLQTSEKGSLKRDDFLRKIVSLVKSLPEELAKSLGVSAVKASDKYTYDSFPSFGEAGHVLRTVLAIAQKLPISDREPFLRDCILYATDDTMALRVLTILTKQKDEADLKVSEAALFPSFVKRMRSRYGRHIDAATVDLSTSDPWAFDAWGRTVIDGITLDSEDRQIQYDFWRRYIGNSRSRLAQAFQGFFLPVAVYPANPELVVENKIPMSDLKRLYEELPEDTPLTERELKALDTLRRLLDGEFQSGVGPMSNLYGSGTSTH